MSCYFLCDYCAKKLDADHLNTCVCIPSYPREHRKKVMYDHHGRDGKRYDEPTDVCKHYEPREGHTMKTISPYEALQGNEYVVATREKPRHVYGLYPTKDIAERICNDLNKRYGDKYEACAIDFGDAI